MKPNLSDFHYVFSFTAKSSEWYIQYSGDRSPQFVGKAKGRFILTSDESGAIRFQSKDQAKNELVAALERGELTAPVP